MPPLLSRESPTPGVKLTMLLSQVAAAIYVMLKYLDYPCALPRVLRPASTSRLGPGSSYS